MHRKLYKITKKTKTPTFIGVFVCYEYYITFVLAVGLGLGDGETTLKYPLSA
jgi:hypothetical protein